ncbi:MAG TPA: transglycosylase [Acetobacteraceae bacterium]|nr:transglycosylase [Acetobacteraceae bacterium]
MRWRRGILRRGAALFGLIGAIVLLPEQAGAQTFGDADPGIVMGSFMPVRSAAPARAPDTLFALRAVPAPVTAPAPRAAQPTPAASPRAVCLDATRAAEARHDLPEGLLVAIALNESGLHAYALSIRGRSHFSGTREEAERLYRDGLARGSVMAGCLQVNAGVHARREAWPLDAPAAADWAGRFLRDAYARTGSWAEAVRIWHGGRPGSAPRLACRVRAKLDVTAPHSGLFRDLGCGQGTAVARLRRNGETHLQIAQADER